jgi:hypothetical protein
VISAPRSHCTARRPTALTSSSSGRQPARRVRYRCREPRQGVRGRWCREVTPSHSQPSRSFTTRLGAGPGRTNRGPQSNPRRRLSAARIVLSLLRRITGHELAAGIPNECWPGPAAPGRDASLQKRSVPDRAGAESLTARPVARVFQWCSVNERLTRRTDFRCRRIGSAMSAESILHHPRPALIKVINNK